MIEPLLWSLMCAAGLGLCWVKVRTGGMLMAFLAAGFGAVYAWSGWVAFLAFLEAMDAISAGLAPQPFRVTLLIAAPLIVTLAWPAVRDLFSRRGGHAHGPA